MATRLAGIGVGLLVVVVLWVLALTLCLTLSRARGKARFAGLPAVLLAALLTLVLWFLPRGGSSSAEERRVIYDEYVVGRLALLVVSAVFALVGFFGLFTEHFTFQRTASRLKKMT